MRRETTLITTLVLAVVFAAGLVGTMASTAGAAYLVDPIAHWKLEETTKPYLDSTANGYDLDCSGTCPVQTTGIVGNGQFFDNSGSGSLPALRVPDAKTPGALFNWAWNQDFSIELWFKRAPDSTTDFPDGTEVFIGRNDSSGTTKLRWYVGIYEDGSLEAVFKAVDGAGAGILLTTPSGEDYADDKWHHVVVVRQAQEAGTADKIDMYVDGQWKASISPTYNDGKGFKSDTVQLRIGELDLSPYYEFGGTLDEIALYSQALSPAVIYGHYQAGLQGKGYDESFAPVILPGGPYSGYVGYVYTQQVVASGNPLPAFSLGTNAPAGMSIDSASGEINWTPNSQQTGANVFTAVATNSEGQDTEDFTVNVSDLCSDPTMAYWRLEEETDLTFADAAGAKDGQTLADNRPARVDGVVGYGQQFDGTDDYIAVANDGSGSDVFDWTGSFTIQAWVNRADGISALEVVLARDAGPGELQWWLGIRDDDAAQIHLRDSDGVVVDATSSTDVADGQWHLLTAVYDADGKTVKLYVDGSLEASAAAAFTGTFAAANASPVVMGNLKAGDSYSFAGSMDEVLLIGEALSEDMISQFKDRGEIDNKGYCNAAPVITTTAPDTAKVGVEYTYSPAASDPDGDTLSWSLVNEPGGMTINGSTGAISWTPADTTTANFTLVVNDGFGGQDTESITITVSSANQAPVINGQKQTVTTKENTAVTLTIGMLDVTDPDTPADQLTLIVLPGTNYSKSGNTITPDAGFTGDLTVPVRVSDGTNQSDVFNMTVTVTKNEQTPSSTPSSGGSGGGGGCFIVTSAGSGGENVMLALCMALLALFAGAGFAARRGGDK